MDRRQNISVSLLGLLGLLFVFAQGITAAHAVEHGDNPHLHDGKVCAISVLQDRSDDFVVPDQITAPVPVATLNATAIAQPDPVPAARLSLPPARAPPATR